MKKLKYTLIELLAAMGIFIMMIGILFQTFVTGSDIAASETVKMNLLSDANIFYNYLTDDIRNIDMLAIQMLRDKDNDNVDPDSPNASPANETNESTGKKFHFATGKVSFYSTSDVYNDTDTLNYNGVDLTGLAGSPYIAYELVGTSLVRKMYADQATYVSDEGVYADLTTTAELDDTTVNVPIILEGVVDFSFKVWSDYPGGTEISTNQSPLSEKPSCITFTLTLKDPNPSKTSLPTAVQERSYRTVSKTIYIDR